MSYEYGAKSCNYTVLASIYLEGILPFLIIKKGAKAYNIVYYIYKLYIYLTEQKNIPGN